MHHFVTEMCTFLLQNDALWEIYGLVHCGICAIGLMWVTYKPSTGSDYGLAHALPEQRWLIVNWNTGNKLHWNINRDSYILIQYYAFENVVCKISTIFSRPQFVNLKLVEIIVLIRIRSRHLLLSGRRIEDVGEEVVLRIDQLTHWGRDKMAAISQTTLSSVLRKLSDFK